jgi:hypothetical protein
VDEQTISGFGPLGALTPEDCPGPDECGPAIDLHKRIDGVEASVRILAASNVHLSNQLTELKQEQDKQRIVLNDTAAGMAKLATAVSENTDLTRDIRDALVTARTTSKFVRWLAPTILAAAAVLAAVKGWAVDVEDWMKK